MKPSKLFRRLLPLYIGTFLQGMVFWYAVEKLFMVSIGFDSGSIGLMVALYSAISIVMEVPSGIIADRWSRRGVLILASISLAISSAIGGLSDTVAIYLISAAFWGMFDALYSGTSESIMYDLLLEEKGNSKSFERDYGTLQAIASSAFMISALLGGVIGSMIGLRETYWYSIPIALASIFFLFQFREPQLHKHSLTEPLVQHIKVTFSAVFRRKNLLWILSSLISTSIMFNILMEMGQVWLIALAAPIILYGPASALFFSAWGVGGVIARYITRKRTLIVCMSIVMVGLLTLVATRWLWLNIVAQLTAGILSYGVTVVLTRQLHDNLPSRVRAGSASAVNTVSRLFIIPLSLLFGAIANTSSIFVATWLLVGIFAIAFLSELLSSKSIFRHKEA